MPQSNLVPLSNQSDLAPPNLEKKMKDLFLCLFFLYGLVFAYPTEHECDEIRQSGQARLPSTVPYNDADEILPGVWLGNVCAATNSSFLKENNIRRVIDVTWHSDVDHPRRVHVDKVEMQDGEQDVIYYTGDTIAHNLNSMSLIKNKLVDAESYIHACTHPLCGGVLVHCRMGISRSSSIIIYHLMQHHRFSYDDALFVVKKMRPVVRPNPIFENFLRE